MTQSSAEQDSLNASSPVFCLKKVVPIFNAGKKVLHIDRNPFYGGEGASVNLTNLWKLFKDGKEPPK